MQAVLNTAGAYSRRASATFYEAIRQRSRVGIGCFVIDHPDFEPQIQLIEHAGTAFMRMLWWEKRGPVEPAPILMLEGNPLATINADANKTIIALEFRSLSPLDQDAVEDTLLQSPPAEVQTLVCVPRYVIDHSIIEDWQRERAEPDYRRTYDGIHNRIMIELEPKLRNGDRILDAGCGDGQMLSLLAGYSARAGIYLGLFGFDKALRSESYPGTADVVEADALSLPYPDNHFQVVIASGLVNVGVFPAHLGGRVKAELARVVAPGGRLIITGKSPILTEHNSEVGHYQFPGPEFEKDFEFDRRSFLWRQWPSLQARQFLSMRKNLSEFR
jgi:SAM-dependent methyltransferase